MAFQTIHDLPITIQSTLPPEAQEVYLARYNEVLQRPDLHPTGDLAEESMAHQVAWHAVEEEFVKADDGKWYRQGQVPVAEDQESQSLLDKIRNFF